MVTINPDSQVEGDSSTLTFTPADWNVAQVLTALRVYGRSRLEQLLPSLRARVVRIAGRGPSRRAPEVCEYSKQGSSVGDDRRAAAGGQH